MALAAGASAQVQQSAGSINTKVAPNKGAYNMETGFELAAPQTYRLGPETIFDNTQGATYYFTTMLSTEEFVDEMAFPADDIDGDEQIDGVVWEYCSTTPDAGTNDVVDVELRFYNDTVLGAGRPVGTMQALAPARTLLALMASPAFLVTPLALA